MHNIQLTSEQFKTLLKLVYLGEWIVNAHKIEHNEEFDRLSKYLFSLTKEFKIPGISIDEEPEYPSAQFEQGEVSDHINEYDNLTFWDELTNRLVDRIFKKQFSSEQRKSMDLETRIKHLIEIENKVKNHLEIHGIDQIKIK